MDTARNAALLEDPSAAGHTRPFVEGFTDACLMAQNVVNAAESLGMGANYLGNIHNDLQAVVDLLELPQYTFPVVGLTLGWPAQEPQLKPRIPARLRVMENTYQAPASWEEALAEYDQEMTTYYDLRDANRRSDNFFRQVRAGMRGLSCGSWAGQPRVSPTTGKVKRGSSSRSTTAWRSLWMLPR